jgi:hypothetical protein
MIYTAVMRRDLATSIDAFAWSFRPRSVDDYEMYVINNAPRRYRIVTTEGEYLLALRALRDRRPDLGLEVVDLRTVSPS